MASAWGKDFVLHRPGTVWHAMEQAVLALNFDGVRKRIWRYVFLVVIIAYIWAAARAIL